MPDQTDQTEIDPRDLRIRDLEAQVKSLTAEINEMNEHFDVMEMGHEGHAKVLENQLAALRAQPSVSLPAGDVVVLAGVVHPILRTVRANTTFDEVKKGYIDEGATLAVIEQKH